MNDTFFFLLDHPDRRDFELLTKNVRYQTPRFDQAVYERSRGMRFDGRDAAYADWMGVGRTEGLEYAPGVDTLLKIVLKVKDEPVLLEKWITYHGAIAGLSNLVIMDCGSTDPDHLAILEAHRRDLLVLRYPDHYDRIHSVRRNQHLYYWLTRNCRYLTVIDADEFMFGFDGRTISPHHVADLLRASTEPVHAPTWIHNELPPAEIGGQIDWSQPMRFNLDPESLRAGVVAGKSVIRSTALSEIGYVGHNLHVRAVSSRMTAGSFGRLFQFHVSDLGERINRARFTKHLRTRGFLPADIVAPAAVEAFLAPYRNGAHPDLIIAYYVDKYFAQPPAPGGAAFFESRLLAGARSEDQPAFSSTIGAFDFERVRREHKPAM